MKTEEANETNAELELAWQLVEKTGVNVFLTGKAGTGKTTFLRRLKDTLPKRMVVVAPTGVAAINAGGVTIHSFFQLPLSPFVPGGTVKTDMQRKYQFSKVKKNIIRTLDLLVIDEISMVRADLLDAIDDVLRRYRDSRLPFGGVQLLMIGDLQQLAPVVKDDEWLLLRDYYDTPYFFGSRALQQTQHVTIELQQVYRQTDDTFVSLLGKVRTGTLTAADVALLNTRVLAGHEAEPVEGVIRLTTHNRTADDYNLQRLRDLPGRARQYRATIEGTFPVTSYPADDTLSLKPGCQVMFLKNDVSAEHLFYNGKLARVVEVADEHVTVEGLEDGRLINVTPMEWANARYVIDRQSREIREEVEGIFRQYPLRLAWAITIHKSQGLTFDHAVLDVGAAFAAGQTYVALSRLRTLQGLILTEPLRPGSVITDAYVTRYMDSELRQAAALPGRMDKLQREYRQHLLAELFDFQPMRWTFQKLLRLTDEHLYRQYPRLLARMKESAPQLDAEVFDVAPRFLNQCAAIISGEGDEAHLAERIGKACPYFLQKMASLLAPLLAEAETLESDNQRVAEQLDEVLDTLRRQVSLKTGLLSRVQAEGFDVASYLRHKARVVLDIESGSSASATPAAGKAKASKQASGQSKRKKKDTVPHAPSRGEGAEDSDVSYPELYATLRRWRAAQAYEEHKGAYLILSNATLIAICDALPTRITELQRVKGMGPAKCARYGEAVLEIVRDYISENADPTI